MDLHFLVDREPVSEGRYLVYTRADDDKSFARPIILTWFEADWHYLNSSVRYASPVYAWSGPLLVGKIDELFPPTPDRPPNPPQSTKFAPAVFVEEPEYNGSAPLRAEPLEYDL